MKQVNKILDILEHMIIVISLSAMLILILIATGARIAKVASFPWGEEAARYFMIWLSMIAVSAAFKKDEHMGLSFFVELFHGKAKKILLSIRYMIIIGFCGIVVWQGLLIVQNQMKFIQYSPSLRIPMYFLYGSIPAGFTLCIIRLAICFAACLQDTEN